MTSGLGALYPGLHSPALSDDVRPDLPVSHGMWLVSGVIAPVSMGTRPSHAREKQRATVSSTDTEFILMFGAIFQTSGVQPKESKIGLILPPLSRYGRLLHQSCCSS